MAILKLGIGAYFFACVYVVFTDGFPVINSRPDWHELGWPFCFGTGNNRPFGQFFAFSWCCLFLDVTILAILAYFATYAFKQISSGVARFNLQTLFIVTLAVGAILFFNSDSFMSVLNRLGVEETVNGRSARPCDYRSPESFALPTNIGLIGLEYFAAIGSALFFLRVFLRKRQVQQP